MPEFTFGPIEDLDDGSLQPITLPLSWRDTLPASAPFPGALVYEKDVGWSWWNGTIFVSILSSESFLDADTLDGLDSTAFVRQTEVAYTPGANTIPRADSESFQINQLYVPRAIAGPAYSKIVGTHEFGYIDLSLLDPTAQAIVAEWLATGWLNAHLADVPTATFKGRTTAGTGKPEDLTVAQAKTLLSLAGSNTGDQTITLTGDVTGSGTGSFATTIGANKVQHSMLQTQLALSVLGRAGLTAGVPNAIELTVGDASDYLFGSNGAGSSIGWDKLRTGQINSDAVTNAKLANMATNSVKARVTAATGDPEDLAVGASQWVGRLAAGQLAAQTMANLWAELLTASPAYGTSFPGSPVDGQRFYRTDLKVEFNYNAAISKWLGVNVFEIEGGDVAAMAISTFYREYTLGATAQRYTATYGRQFGFDVVCVGMTILTVLTPAVSARAVVTDAGTAVTGASLTLTAPATSTQDETLLSSVITAGHIIGLQNDALGATLGATKVIARFRRAAT